MPSDQTLGSDRGRRALRRRMRQEARALLRRTASLLRENPTLRGAYLRSLPDGDLVTVRTLDGLFVVNSSDHEIGGKTFIRRRAYDSEKIKLVIGLLPSSHSRQLIVDVGANIGTISIPAILNKQFGKAIAFEPEPKNFQLLRVNVYLNGVESAVELHNLALSDGPAASLEFELASHNFGDHRVRVGCDQGPGIFNEEHRDVITVKAAVLDDFATDWAPDSAVVWVDTQGFEGRVLKGAQHIIGRRIPLCFEFWPYGLRRAQAFDALFEALTDSNYESLIDIGDGCAVHQFDVGRLHEIARRLGPDGNYTDILLI